MMKLVHDGFTSFWVLDNVEQALYENIEAGRWIPSGSNNKVISNALTRLRRNGFIKNEGSRTKPKWTVSRKMHVP